MNNLEYICTHHCDLVGSILEDLACEDRDGELNETLGDFGLPAHVFESCEAMGDWLSEERQPGAWQPHDSVADITRDVKVMDDGGVADYLDRRGIGYDSGAVEKLALLAVRDISARYAEQFAILKIRHAPLGE